MISTSITPTKEQIRRLGAHDVEKVIHRSIKSLFVKNKINLNYLDRSPYQYRGDGGMETSFSITEDKVDLEPFFSSNYTLIQSKATEKVLTRSEVKKELDKELVKQFFTKCTDCNFIVSYSKTMDFREGKTSKAYNDHKEEIISVLQELYPDLASKIKVDIWLTEDLESLIAQAPCSWELIPENSFLQLGANTLALVEERNVYYRKNVFKSKFVANKERQEKLDDLKQKLMNNDEDIVEMRGMMGIGKTRLSYEVIKALELEDVCIWLDQPNLQLLNQINSYLSLDPSHSIVIFNDEATPQTINAIKNLKYNFPTQLKALVVMPFRGTPAGKSNDQTVTLGKMSKEELSTIVESYSLPNELSQKIIEICNGYPKLALTICNRIKDVSNTITTKEAIELLSGDFEDPQDPTKGWYRLILSEEDKNILGPLSILFEVGVKGGAVDELKTLSEIFDFKLNKAQEAIRENIKKGIVVQVNDYIYITPLLLADHLACNTVKNHIHSLPEIIEKLGNLNPRQGRFYRSALDSFMERLKGCADDKELKDSVLDFSQGLDINFFKASLHNIDVLKFAIQVGHIYPDYVLKMYERSLKEESKKLIHFKEGRRDLIRFLEKAAFYPDYFDLSLRSLKHLAIYENETWANNATGIFIGYFSPYLSGSSKSFRERAKFLLKEVYNSNNFTAYDDILISCLERTIRSTGSRMSGHENAFSIPDIPKEIDKEITYAELNSVKLMIFEEIKSLPKDRVRISYFKKCASELRQLAHGGLNFEENGTLDYLISLNNHFVDLKIINSLKNILEFDGDQLGDERKKKFEEIESKLVNKDFKSQLLNYLAHYRLDNDPVLSKLENNIFEKLFENNSLLTKHVDIIFNSENSRSFTFFYQLGKRDDKQAFWPTILELASVKSQKSSLDYLYGLSSSNSAKDAYNRLLEVRKLKILSKEEVLKFLANIDTPKSQAEVFSFVEELGPSALDIINYSNFSRDLDEEKANKLISCLESQPSSITKILANKLEELDLSKVNLTTVLSDLASRPQAGMDFWYIKEKIVPKTIKLEKYKPIYLSVFKDCLVVTSGKGQDYSFDHSSFCSDLSKIIAKEFPSETFKLFFDFYVDSDNSPYLPAIHYKGWPYRIYEKEFLELFKVQPKDLCKRFLAFLPNEHGVFTEHSSTLVKRFEDDNEIGSQLSVLLFSTFDVVVGDFSDHLMSLIEKFEKWEKTFDISENRIVIELKESLKVRYNAELKSEAEERYFMNREQG